LNADADALPHRLDQMGAAPRAEPDGGGLAAMRSRPGADQILAEIAAAVFE
jgi:hypothetical protein